MKPAIFNTAMVRAILDGRKTQTRRIASDTAELVYRCAKSTPSAPYQIGDIIYVRETFGTQIRTRYGGVGEFLVYRADYQNKELQHEGYPAKFKSSFVKWKPSIHMPKEHARLFLRVKDIRIERLNEISHEDSIKEGIIKDKEHESWILGWKNYSRNVAENEFMTPHGSFKSLWESIYGNGSFDNRYVWVIEFERISKEEAYRYEIK